MLSVGRLLNRGGASGALKVLLPQWLLPGSTTARAGSAVRFDSTGMASAAANEPRFTRSTYVAENQWTGAPGGGRLLIEDAKTNIGTRNPRSEGIAAGTIGGGGALPTHWATVNALSGLSRDVSAITAAGMPGIRVRFYGTTSGSPGAETIETDARSTNACSASTQYTGSVYYRLSAGSLPSGAQLFARLLTVNGSAAVVDNANGSALALDGAIRRGTNTLVVGATAAFINVGMHLASLPAGTACDFTVDFFLPQVEAGPGATSPMLPPVGAPALASRSADQVSVPIPASLLAGGTMKPFTVVVRAMLPQTPAAIIQGLLTLDNGTGANRIALRSNNMNNISAITVAANVASSAATVAAGFAVGAPFTAALAVEGGNLYLSSMGSAVATVAATLPSALTTVRFGVNSVAGQYLNGEVESVVFYPRRLSDAELMAMSAA